MKKIFDCILAALLIAASIFVVYRYFNNEVYDTTTKAIETGQKTVEGKVNEVHNIYIDAKQKASGVEERVEKHVAALDSDGVALELNTLLSDSRRERRDSESSAGVAKP